MHRSIPLLALTMLACLAAGALAQTVDSATDDPPPETRLLGKGEGYLVHLIQAHITPTSSMITDMTFTNDRRADVEILQYTNLKTGEAKTLHMVLTQSPVPGEAIQVLLRYSHKILNAVADDHYVYVLYSSTIPGADQNTVIVLRAWPLAQEDKFADVTVATVSTASLKTEPHVDLKDGVLTIGTDQYVLDAGTFKKN